MRKLVLAVIITLVLPCVASAQKNNELTLSLTDLSANGSYEKENWYGGLGLSYTYFVAPRFSACLSVAAEDRETYPYIVNPTNGAIIPVTPEKITIYPYAATAKYHWVNDTNWKPYLGGGLRYVAAPKVDTRFGYEDRFAGLLLGGVTYRFMPSLGATLEAQAIVGDHESYDPPFRASLGLTWRF